MGASSTSSAKGSQTCSCVPLSAGSGPPPPGASSGCQLWPLFGKKGSWKLFLQPPEGPGWCHRHAGASPMWLWEAAVPKACLPFPDLSLGGHGGFQKPPQAEGSDGHPHHCPGERLTAAEMDEQRRQNVAYQYLCRLEEAKRWMEACLGEGLPPPTELEETLRNGVLLAKLGHCFAPAVVPLKKIYDCEQTRYKAAGLHFRHTDNINYWRDAMSHVGLPSVMSPLCSPQPRDTLASALWQHRGECWCGRGSLSLPLTLGHHPAQGPSRCHPHLSCLLSFWQIFHPETTDIYDKKNMPRVVYCIHALSLYLFKLGLAPQIQDLYGKVNFTEEEINNMKRELEKYGLQLPAFSKIGGILANELSVDEAAVHAAVLAINEAVDQGVVAQTMETLRNPSAMLQDLRGELAGAYQEVLHRAKLEKGSNARNRYLQVIPEGEDVYDWCLTQAEIQGNINKVNVHGALEEVDDALQRQDVPALHRVLQDPVLALRCLQRDNLQLYLEQLSMDREQKALDLGYLEMLDQKEVQAGILTANRRGEEERAMLLAVSRINAAIRRGMLAETLEALMDPAAQLPDVHPSAAPLYQHQLALLQRQHPQGELAQEELFVAVEMLSAVALVNQALDVGDPDGLWSSLVSPALGLSGVEDANAQRYFEDLQQLKGQPRGAGAEFLSWNDIQDSVNSTNSLVQDENDRVHAVRLVNEALLQADPEKTLAALLLLEAALPDIALPTAQRYHDVLSRARRQKAQAMGDDGAVLWWEEIQEGVCRANQDTVAARRMALGIAAINQAIKEGKTAQTLRVLRNPDVALCGVVSACAGAYQEQLAALVATKRPAGSEKLYWIRHRLPDGAEYYLSLKTFEGSWQCPRDSGLNTTHLSREEIQLVVTRVTAAHDRECLWASNTSFVVRLQARIRGFLVRREFAVRRHILREQQPAAVRIQACWRGYKQRRAYLERLCYLRANAEAAIKIQAGVRMWQARRKYQERLRYFRQNIKAVIKIQAFVRANKARGDYRMLVHTRRPPLSIVRRFIHLLEQSQHDFWEESEVLRLQEEVVKRIRASRQLESDLDLMDIKIGLLVKNRITLQEVVSHCKKLTKKNKEQLSEMMSIDKQKGLKSLSKEKRQKLEAYQHLFYLLQTQPVYLARLIFQMPQNKSTKFMESVIFTLYNYASNPREAYLLLQLFKVALQEEVRSKVDHVHDILTGNATVIRLVVSFYRNTRGQNALRQILGGPVQEVLQDKALGIRTDPVDIYKAWINQAESQSGQRSKLPYEVSPEQALSHPEVQRRLDISIQNLLAMTDKFVSAITSSVDKIPYGMRYMAKILRTSLTEKFPKAPAEEIDKIVGNLLYYRFMNPAVVAPDGFDIVDISAGATLHPEQRRSLGSIAKVLQHAAARKAFDGENAHLCGVNQYLEDTHNKFRRFISAACCVPEPEERFNMDEYSEMVAVAKPVIYITVGELINTHKLLLEHQDSIAPHHGDPLHELLEDLDEIPTVQSLVGESVASLADSGAEQVLSQLSRTEISLTLTGKLLPAASSEESDTRSLLLSTKQMLVDVIQSQSGDSLPEILWTQALEHEEAAHDRLVHRRVLQDAQTPTQLKWHRSLAANGQLSMEEKKRKIIRNLRHLESLGLVDSAHQYQELIDELAKDIRNQRRHRQHRRAELLKLRQTLHSLDAKTLFYEEQIDYYNQYIKTCLDNLAASNKVSRKSKKLPSLHYTAARLLEKGVLLEIQDLPPSQFKNVIFDIIPCEESGKFQVKAKFMGIDMEHFQLHYQDLLQLQYEGVAVMKMFGKAKVNVNLLIFLLNKKFFKK
ncbi:ras GTPase-activating-like protein IQGAP3 isoform X2 [Pseudopipra pipra]|uniref:ras GTPase-activating-like protein IQGAP3 isoform X2 n=1 Tax=Pseudopipra pipra TaxID=415032 RepID=UPI003138D24E